MSSADAVEAAKPAPTFSKGYRGWLLFILLLVNALNLADRQGMAVTAPAIKADLHLTDSQVGLILGLGFAIFYTLLGLPLARMAERMNRARIVSVCVAVFGGMVAACGAATGFAQFLLCRVGVGVGDAGFGPPVASLIGDHYPMRKRASAMTIIWLGAPIGAVAGSVGGGWVAQHVGWRTWFLILSIPAVLVALVGFFTLRDPPRGMSDEGGPTAVGAAPPSIWEVVRFLWAKKSFRHILAGGALAAMSMNALGQFLARFLVAEFHVGYAEAGRLLGMMSGVAMASGLALGGFGVDWAGKFDRRWYVWGPAATLLLAAPLFFIGADQKTVVATVLVMMLGHVALFVYYTPTLALAQNMAGANMRASSAFVASLVLGLIGTGLGPTVVGILSDVMAHQAFKLGDFGAMCPGGAAPAGADPSLGQACSSASAAGVKHAIMAMSLLFAWASLHYLLASRHLRKDLDTRYDPKDAAVEALEART